MSDEEPKFTNDVVQNIIAGGAARLASATALHPIDLVVSGHRQIVQVDKNTENTHAISTKTSCWCLL